MSRIHAVVQAARAIWGRELVAIDGSKFGAVNSPKRNFTEKKLRRMIKEIDAKIDQYLKQLDQQDKQEAGQRGVSPEQLKEKIEQYKSGCQIECKKN